MSSEKNRLEGADLPSYSEYSTTQALTETAHPTEDGRVDIDLDSRLARTLAAVTNLPNTIIPVGPPPPYTQTEWQLPLSIVIQVVGSRGDVQPFVALGQELQRVGHRVRIATHGVFANFVQQAGLEFFSIGGDPAELMAYMVKNPGLIPEMKTLRAGEISKKRQMVREMLVGCWNSCIEPDPDTQQPFAANAIIANPPSFAHIHCAQALGVPVHVMFTMPWTPTQAFPHPLARLRPSKVGKGMANYLSYGLVQALTWQGLGDIINKFRKSLDLEAVPLTEGAFLAETLKVPQTYCWSPSLVPKPSDWPEHIDVCGFFFREIPSYDPPERLRDFLSSGTTPIYIGFGSIVIDDPDKLTDLIVEAVQLSGTRAIISAGWSRLGANYTGASADILFLNEDCPHEWLFPRVTAVIHHGGAGTTACGLLNGRPTMVVPFFGDQFFWGDMIAQAGAGPLPIRHAKLNAQNLKTAIEVCTSPEAALRAAKIAEGMKSENGVAAAVASFHRHLPQALLSCDLDPKLPAIWTYNKSTRVIKLSGPASEILVKENKVKARDLKPYLPSRITIINQRWDPATAVVSSLTGTSIDILNAGNSIWKSPLDIHKEAVKTSKDGKVTPKDIAAMVGSSTMSIPRIYGAIAKGVLVDLPMALTEGLRVSPRLYGEEIKPLDPIVDWKSGGVVAGKTFVHNMRDSITGVYKLPAKGMQEEGVVGLSKGVGKGLVGLVTKSGSALTGLLAYPTQGFVKSIHSTVFTGTRKAIVEAKRQQSRYAMRETLMDEHAEMELVRRFDELMTAEKHSV